MCFSCVFNVFLMCFYSFSVRTTHWLIDWPLSNVRRNATLSLTARRIKRGSHFWIFRGRRPDFVSRSVFRCIKEKRPSNILNSRGAKRNRVCLCIPKFEIQDLRKSEKRENFRAFETPEKGELARAATGAAASGGAIRGSRPCSAGNKHYLRD